MTTIHKEKDGKRRNKEQGERGKAGGTAVPDNKRKTAAETRRPRPRPSFLAGRAVGTTNSKRFFQPKTKSGTGQQSRVLPQLPIKRNSYIQGPTIHASSWIFSDLGNNRQKKGIITSVTS